MGNPTGRGIRIAVATLSACALALGSVSAGELPKAEMKFSVAGETYLGGQEVQMSGRIQPATVRERIRLETQVYKNQAWRAYDLKRTRTTRRGRFSYTHDAFPAGKRYRTRAKWRETVDHQAGRTVWDNFRVAKRAR